MSIYFNYIIEANLGLLLFLSAYFLFLHAETDFKLKRYFLLSSLLCSVLFPLLHFQINNQELIPKLGSLIPTVWLPEVVISGEANNEVQNQPPSILKIWNGIQFIYLSGVIFFLVQFLLQITKLIMLFKQPFYRHNTLAIVESTEDKPTFSFFSFIFIGQSHLLSQKDKKQIITHEEVHAKQLHSFDVLLLHVISIFFWFNPILYLYKKTFIQLHEFEADARAVKTNDVNDYCSLLARVALLSADIRIANYFNNSLTVKRIEMMRKIKSKIKLWKIGALAFVIPLTFFIIACQDQVLNEITEIAKSSTMALEVPADVQERYELLTKENPNNKYILIQLNDEGTKTLEGMEKKYGLPTSMEVFKANSEGGESSLSAKASSGIIITKENSPSLQTSENVSGFVILEYNSLSQQVGDLSKEGDVFLIVEETAQPQGGMEAFYRHIMKNMRYPKEAREKRIEGKVFIEFIVEPDGTLSNISVLKGVDPSVNNEALRVMEESPKWNPGKQRGKTIRQKLVLPISFSLGKKEEAPIKTSNNPDNALNEIFVVGYGNQK